jgi:hypothetical protein
VYYYLAALAACPDFYRDRTLVLVLLNNKKETVKSGMFHFLAIY